MAGKRIAGRRLRPGAQNLSPGQSVGIERRGGKRFELTPIDSGPANFNARMDQIFGEIPTKGRRVKTNLARLLSEERE